MDELLRLIEMRIAAYRRMNKKGVTAKVFSDGYIQCLQDMMNDLERRMDNGPSARS